MGSTLAKHGHDGNVRQLTPFHRQASKADQPDAAKVKAKTRFSENFVYPLTPDVKRCELVR